MNQERLEVMEFSSPVGMIKIFSYFNSNNLESKFNNIFLLLLFYIVIQMRTKKIFDFLNNTIKVVILKTVQHYY